MARGSVLPPAGPHRRPLPPGFALPAPGQAQQRKRFPAYKLLSADRSGRGGGGGCVWELRLQGPALPLMVQEELPSPCQRGASAVWPRAAPRWAHSWSADGPTHTAIPTPTSRHLTAQPPLTHVHTCSDPQVYTDPHCHSHCHDSHQIPQGSQPHTRSLSPHILEFMSKKPTNYRLQISPKRCICTRHTKA